MQQVGCLPGPAYRVQGPCRISSVFGEYDEAIEREYYPEGCVAKAQAIATANESLAKIADSEKAVFLATYRDMLKAFDAENYGLSCLFDRTGKVAGEKAEVFLEAEWKHYLDGTYGLCTRNGTPSEIATKEIMIARIKHLTADLSKPASDIDLSTLADAVDKLDMVSASFAPHEVKQSSRGKYIDAVKRLYFGAKP